MWLSWLVGLRIHQHNFFKLLKSFWSPWSRLFDNLNHLNLAGYFDQYEKIGKTHKFSLGMEACLDNYKTKDENQTLVLTFKTH